MQPLWDKTLIYFGALRRMVLCETLGASAHSCRSAISCQGYLRTMLTFCQILSGTICGFFATALRDLGGSPNMDKTERMEIPSIAAKPDLAPLPRIHILRVQGFAMSKTFEFRYLGALLAADRADGVKANDCHSSHRPCLFCVL